jgi:hypothetical protein
MLYSSLALACFKQVPGNLAEVTVVITVSPVDTARGVPSHSVVVVFVNVLVVFTVKVVMSVQGSTQTSRLLSYQVLTSCVTIELK